MKDSLHPSHVTRVSIDSSSYDEVCINCGATDMVIGGWGQLRFPCPNEVKVIEPWEEYANDFDNLTDDEIRQEVLMAENDLNEAENWLEAVASWERAGKPRTVKDQNAN